MSPRSPCAELCTAAAPDTVLAAFDLMAADPDQLTRAIRCRRKRRVAG